MSVSILFILDSYYFYEMAYTEIKRKGIQAMKREDLYRNRGQQPAAIHRRIHSRRFGGPETGKRYPLCHWLQVFLALAFLLCVVEGQLLFSQETAKTIKSEITESLTYSITLPDSEWSGSLKEILLPSESNP